MNEFDNNSMDKFFREMLGVQPEQGDTTAEVDQSNCVSSKNPSLWASSEQAPAVSLNMDYEIDTLNMLVSSDCLKASPPKRTESVENLLQCLRQPQEDEEMEVEEVDPQTLVDQDFDQAYQNVQMQQMQQQLSVPTVLQSYQEETMTKPISTGLPIFLMENQPDQQFLFVQQQYQQQQYEQQQYQKQQYQQQMNSTSNTNMACTLEYQTVKVTQLPNQPEVLLKNEPQDDLPNLKVFQKEEFKDEVSSLNSSFTSSMSPLEEAPLLPLVKAEVQQADPDVVKKAEHIKEELARLRVQGDSAKVQVSEFVLFILQHHHCHCQGQVSLDKLFRMCNHEGTPTDNCGADHFMATDTKAIGQLWQALKGNRNSNYDTFARGLRVGRERHKGIIEYLEAGRGAKKKIYRFSRKGLEELDSMGRKMRHPR